MQLEQTSKWTSAQSRVDQLILIAWLPPCCCMSRKAPLATSKISGPGLLIMISMCRSMEPTLPHLRRSISMEPAVYSLNRKASIPCRISISILMSGLTFLGPTWFYGSSAEHSVIYQYQLKDAQNIFMSHIQASTLLDLHFISLIIVTNYILLQTETPYFQPDPDASQPYTLGSFNGDPTFEDCVSGTSCENAWALRIISSQDILIYSAGLYSFFQNYDESCVDTETCQLRLIETSYTEGLWLYNIFTKGGEQVVSPDGGIPPLYQSISNQT